MRIDVSRLDPDDVFEAAYRGPGLAQLLKRRRQGDKARHMAIVDGQRAMTGFRAFLRPAEPDQATPELCMGVGHVRPRLDGRPIGVRRLFVLAALHQRIAEPRMRLGETRSQFARAPQTADRFPVASKRSERDAEIVVGFREIGLQRHSRREVADRLFMAADPVERIAEIVVAFRAIRPKRDRAPVAADCLVALAERAVDGAREIVEEGEVVMHRDQLAGLFERLFVAAVAIQAENLIGLLLCQGRADRRSARHCAGRLLALCRLVRLNRPADGM